MLQGLDPVPIMQQFRGGSLRVLIGSIFFLNMKPGKRSAIWKLVEARIKDGEPNGERIQKLRGCRNSPIPTVQVKLLVDLRVINWAAPPIHELKEHRATKKLSKRKKKKLIDCPNAIFKRRGIRWKIVYLVSYHTVNCSLFLLSWRSARPVETKRKKTTDQTIVLNLWTPKVSKKNSPFNLLSTFSQIIQKNLNLYEDRTF